MLKPATTAKKEFRDDIQGVRVLGALLVFAFHVFFNGVSGGVDVFFVVSGYFMARNLNKDGEIGQPFPVLRFYQNFLIRIAPQAIVALIGILLLVAFLGSPMVWAANLRDIAASALYAENWWLINRGGDYLARSESLSLVQHFWAVSLIGQSYLVWPWIVELSRRAALAMHRDARQTLVTLIVSLSVLSFVWSLYFTHTAPTSAYFDFFSRFWEFGSGVLLGLQGRPSTVRASCAALLSWIGVILLISCGFLIGTRLSFPGFASLWPVSAALLIIRFGRPADVLNAGWLLSRRAIAALAAISFGVYLWHWPLYALYQDSSPGAATPLGAGLLILLASALLALLTKSVVDLFFGRIANTYARMTVASVILVTLVSISVSTESARRYVLRNGVSWDAASVREPDFIAPGPFTIRGDNASVYKSGCHQNSTSVIVKSCSFGADDAARTVVLVGGSHSAQWLPALELHAKQENWKIVSMTKSGCLFSDPRDETISSTLDKSCRQWNEDAIAKIVALRPDLVLTIATRFTQAGSTRKEFIPSGYLAWFERLRENDIKVLAIRDNPWMHQDVPRCVYSPVVADKANCGGKRSDLLDETGYQSS